MNNNNNGPKLITPNPIINELTPRGERQYDIFSRLLKDRIIYLASDVNAASANLLIGQLLFLEADAPDKPVHFYINSPGGSVSEGMALYDVMQHVKCPIHTYALGMAASMGSLLLMAGEQGCRYAMPNTRIMIHQPHLGGGGVGGQVTDIEIQAKELVEMKERLTRIYELHTGQNYEKLKALMERDHYLSPGAAKELGLIDHVSVPAKLAKLKK